MPEILILDDSTEDRFFIRRVLKKAAPDVKTHEFSYADQALSFLRSPGRPHVDLLLVDIDLPRMDGFEFANQFLQLYAELRGDAPLYVVSNSINPDDRSRVNAHPAIDGFIEKPVTVDDINRILKEISAKV